MLTSDMIEEIANGALAQITEARSTAIVDDLATKLLGRHSDLALCHRELKTLDPQERREIGRALHETRRRIESALEERKSVLFIQERESFLEADKLDLTEVIRTRVESAIERGKLHVVTQTTDALIDVFVGMGFSVEEGAEAETDWYNFEALNMPPAHPARSMWDTFYLELGEPESVVLRTHTSPVQIHLMEQASKDQTLPIHAVMPGRCYRTETPDARHLAVFHQIEGLVVDKDIAFGDLAGTIETFTSAYFGSDIHSRLRPSYFPFTEPSAEFEITCTICCGEGCRTCSHTGWIELGGCGLVDPAVFDAVGIDPDVWSGFAFGFGVDRCAQMRYQIADMRSLTENDLRFMRRF